MALSEREKKSIRTMLKKKQIEMSKLDEKINVLVSHKDGMTNEITRLNGLLGD